MTEIDKLEGAPLAEAVARSIGFTQDKNHPQWWDDGNGNGICILDGPVYRGDKEVSYRPDLNIAQAWELVEMMRTDGYRLDPLRHDRLGFSLAYIVRFIHEDGDGMPWEAGFIGQGYTAPTAICRAYLKAKAAQ